jgi:hypothetical protein
MTEFCWCRWEEAEWMTHDEYVERNTLPPHSPFSEWESALREYGDDSQYEFIFRGVFDGAHQPEDDEDEDIDCGEEIIDWWSYASDNYRITDDAADSVTAEQPRWVVAEYTINGEGEYVYTALIEPTTLDDARDYQEHPELNLLITAAEAEPDLVKRMEIIDQMGEKIREQIAAASPPRLSAE